MDGKNANSLAFEARFPTGLGGTPPHLDVAIWLSSGEVIAVESKFTEHLRRSTRGKSRFEASYSPEYRRLWEERGMPASHALAEELDGGPHRFEFLDPWQLLKHALGLAKGHGYGFRHIYLYYDRLGKREDSTGTNFGDSATSYRVISPSNRSLTKRFTGDL